MNNPYDNEQFIDAESFINKETFSFQDLILSHLRKLSELCSSELSIGRIEEKPVLIAGSMALVKTYIPDGRSAFIQSVGFLHDLLLPRFDDDMKSKALEIETLINKEKDEARRTQMKRDDWLDVEAKHTRKLFQEINCLLARIQFFEPNRITE